MVAQGRALVLAPEQAAALQFRHDAGRRNRRSAGEIGRQDVEPVGGALDEPFFQRVGDRLAACRTGPSGRAPPRSGCRGRASVMFSRRAISYSTLVEGPAAFAPAAAAAPARRADGRTRRSRSGWPPGSAALVGVSQLCSFASFSRASASLSPMIGITPGQHRELVRARGRISPCAPSGRHRPALAGSSSCTTENTTSAVRAASSSPDGEPPAWMMTGWPCGQRAMLSGPLTLKNRPWWSSGRTFAGIDVPAGRLVGDDRAVLPAVPQPLDDIDELVGALVAQLVLDVLVAG